MFNWFKKLFGFGNEVVSVKPLDAPSGELSYVDVVYQTEDKVDLDLTTIEEPIKIDWCGGSMEYIEPVKEETSIVYEKNIFLVTTDGVPNIENFLETKTFEIPVGDMYKTEALELAEELIEEYKKEVVLPIEKLEDESLLISPKEKENLIDLENELCEMILSYQWELNTAEIRAEIKKEADKICQRYGLSDFDIDNVLTGFFEKNNIKTEEVKPKPKKKTTKKKTKKGDV